MYFLVGRGYWAQSKANWREGVTVVTCISPKRMHKYQTLPDGRVRLVLSTDSPTYWWILLSGFEFHFPVVVFVFLFVFVLFFRFRFRFWNVSPKCFSKCFLSASRFLPVLEINSSRPNYSPSRTTQNQYSVGSHPGYLIAFHTTIVFILLFLIKPFKIQTNLEFLYFLFYDMFEGSIARIRGMILDSNITKYTVLTIGLIYFY